MYMYLTDLRIRKGSRVEERARRLVELVPTCR